MFVLSVAQKWPASYPFRELLSSDPRCPDVGHPIETLEDIQKKPSPTWQVEPSGDPGDIQDLLHRCPSQKPCANTVLQPVSPYVSKDTQVCWIHCTHTARYVHSNLSPGCPSSTRGLPGPCRDPAYLYCTRANLPVLLLAFLFCPLTTGIPFFICKENLKPQRHWNAKSPPASVGFRDPNTFVNLQVDNTPGTRES